MTTMTTQDSGARSVASVKMGNPSLVFVVFVILQQQLFFRATKPPDSQELASGTKGGLWGESRSARRSSPCFKGANETPL